MATVIDHLLVELDLDPKSFDSGKKKAAEAFLFIKQKAEQTGKDVETPLQKMADGFAAVTGRVTKLATAVLGGIGLAKFAEEITKSNIAIGNLSTTTGISVETLSKWQGMADRAGSSAQSISAAILGIDREAKNFATGKGAPALMSVISGLNKAGANIEVFDQQGKIKAATTLLLEISDAIERLKVPRTEAVGLLRNLPGMDESTVALLLKGGANLRKLLKEQDDIYVVTNKNVEAGYKLSESWNRMAQSARALGQTLLTDLEPVLKRIMDQQTKNMSGDRESRQSQTSSLLAAPSKALEWYMNPFGMFGNKKKAGQDAGGGWDESGFTGTGVDDNRLPLGARPRGYSASSNSSIGLGASQDQWDAFRRGVAKIESSGGNYGLMGGAGNKYAGAYQLSHEEIKNSAKSLGEMTPSTSQFLKDPSMQERYFESLTKRNHEQLMKNSKYASMTLEKQLGILGYAHNQGVSGAKKYLSSGVTGRDAFGTPGSKYIDTIQRELNATRNNAPVPWLSNPRLLRAPRYNQTLSSTNNYATSETNVHSLIINGSGKPITDDAYGLGVDAGPALERSTFMNQNTDGPQ